MGPYQGVGELGQYQSVGELGQYQGVGELGQYQGVGELVQYQNVGEEVGCRRSTRPTDHLMCRKSDFVGTMVCRASELSEEWVLHQTEARCRTRKLSKK